MVKRVRSQGGIQVVQQHDVGHIVEITARLQQSVLRQQPLHVLVAALGQKRLPRLFINRVVTRPLLGLLLL